jgi:signal transduction histidine kinase
VVSEACQRAEQLAKPKKISIIANQVPEETVTGHFDSLVELIEIILDNAIKFSPRGSSVFVNGVKAGNYYHVSIRDEGGGLAENDIPFIFDRLYRGDKSRTGHTPGYGLGLSLAREIVNANHGSVTARNYPAGGAQFVVSLPFAKQSKHVG